MMRRYAGKWQRFSQPDPTDSSYDQTDPQSFNRYAYTQNDPVNLIDPSGLMPNECGPGTVPMRDAAGVVQCVGAGTSSVTVYGGRDPIGDAFGAGNGNSGWGGDGFGTLSLRPLREPQNPTPTSQQNTFADCANQAGVEGTGLNEDAANLVSRISASEGTASELLAYTWLKESSFQMNPVPNTNNSTDTGRWDYGPFQVNAYWIGQAIKKGQVSTDGIDIGGALGGHGVKAGQPFAGDVFENGRLAARYLNSLGTGAKAAGLYTGGTRVKERSKGFNDWGPKFQAFFNCFKR